MTQLSLAFDQAEARKFSRDAKMRSSMPEPEVVRSKTPAVSRAMRQGGERETLLFDRAIVVSPRSPGPTSSQINKWTWDISSGLQKQSASVLFVGFR